MIRATLVASFLLACALPASPQHFPSALSDAWNGVVEAIDPATREITLASQPGTKPEIFKGILDEGFKVRLLDDTVAQPAVSEIPLGMRVRAYFETKREEVGGKKVKINHIFAVLFLGRDDFDRLRVRLHLPPATRVAPDPSGRLPAANPLKIYITLDPPRTKDDLVKWAGAWNKENASKYGGIEIVSDAAQADVSLVVYNTLLEMTEPLIFSYGSGTEVGITTLPAAAAFLVVPRADGVSVLWRNNPLISGPRGNVVMSHIEKEIERLMKSRARG